MSSTYIFTLAPVRFPTPEGNGGGRFSSCVRSDTLLSALRSLALETGILAGAFEDPAPPFLASSVFFEVEGVRIYPRPWKEPPALASLERAEAIFFRKIWRSFDFVTEERLGSLAEGRRVRFEPEDIIEKRAWGMPSERKLRGLPRIVPREGIAVDRRGGDVLRLRRSAHLLPRGARLFFLLRLQEPALLAHLKELAARLGEAGLGGERSTGGGKFELAGVHLSPAFLHWERDGTNEGGPFLTLSLYLPRREEVERGVLDGVAGELILRGGWIHSGGPTAFRKRAVRMLAEGTVLPKTPGGVTGEVRDVRPVGFDRHPVWRDGRAFVISYESGGGS